MAASASAIQEEMTESNDIDMECENGQTCAMYTVGAWHGNFFAYQYELHAAIQPCCPSAWALSVQLPTDLVRLETLEVPGKRGDSGRHDAVFASLEDSTTTSTHISMGNQ